MKKVAIFDDCYDKTEELEANINDWVEEYKVKVISIDIKTYIDAYNDVVCANGVKETQNCVNFYGVVVYEE